MPNECALFSCHIFRLYNCARTIILPKSSNLKRVALKTSPQLPIDKQFTGLQVVLPDRQHSVHVEGKVQLLPESQQTSAEVAIGKRPMAVQVALPVTPVPAPSTVEFEPLALDERP